MQSIEEPPHAVGAGDRYQRERGPDREILSETHIEPHERKHDHLSAEGDEVSDQHVDAGFKQRLFTRLHRIARFARVSLDPNYGRLVPNSYASILRPEISGPSVAR